MHYMKIAGRAVSSLFFRVNLLLFAVLTPVVLTLGSPEAIKNSLSASGIYDNALSGAFESLGEPEGRESEQAESAPASRQALQTAANEAFSPSLLENSADSILDGTYRWLNGEVDQPDFQIDLTDAKETFASTLADEAVKEVKQKPICTLEQLRTRQDINLDDPFELPCRPPGFSFAQVRQKINQEINQSEEFLADPVITAEDLNSEGQDSFYDKEQLPNAFQFANRLPWLLGALTLLFAGLLALLHDDRRRAATIITKALLTTGASLLVIALITNLLIGRINFGEQINATAELKTAVLNIIQNLTSELNQRFIILGAILAAAGGGGLFYLHKIKLQNDSKPGAQDSEVNTGHPDKHGKEYDSAHEEKAESKNSSTNTKT